MTEKNRDVKNSAMDRERIIVRTSWVGIVTNIFLAAFKAMVGLLSHSIAVTLDAVNNLSDALSSIVTIVGTKLANKQPDREHPLGHGRAEYLAALIVAGIILYAGITSAVESVKKIISPVKPEYTAVSLLIIAVAVVVKILLGTYVKAQGKKTGSGALVASGTDALFDAIISFSVLASALIFVASGISLEAYVGVLISVFIIKAGVEVIQDTLGYILGKRAEKETTLRIKALLNEEEEVRGAYDLIINNYGPGKDYASVHLELPDTMTVKDVDILTRRVEAKVYRETGVILTGVGVYSYNTSGDESATVYNDVCKRVLSHDWALQLHGFYVDLQAKEMRFDVVMSFDISHREGVEILKKELAEAYPGYSIRIQADVDISDID